MNFCRHTAFEIGHILLVVSFKSNRITALSQGYALRPLLNNMFNVVVYQSQGGATINPR